MRLVFFILLTFIFERSKAAILLTAEHESKGKTIEITYNRSIETFFILRALSDDDYLLSQLAKRNNRDEKLRPMLHEARTYFNTYKNHIAVVETQKLIEKTEDIFGLVCEGLLYARELPDTGFIYEPISGYWKDNRAQLEDYIKILQKFYVEANAASFFAKHEKFYSGAIAEGYKYVDFEVVKAMEDYFGKTNAAYKMIIVPMSPFGMGYGPTINKMAYEIISPANDVQWLESGKYTEFGYGGNEAREYYRDMISHEFTHSFVTDLLFETQLKDQINNYDSLYTPKLDSALQNQAIDEWIGFVNELFVRSFEIRIAETRGLTNDANELRKDYIGKEQFIFIPETEALLINYERNRKKYPKIDDFLPILISQFQNYSKTEMNIRLK